MTTIMSSQPPPSGRGLPLNPAQGLRRIPPPAPGMPPPTLPPIPDKFNASVNTSGTMLSASSPLSAGQVISLARDAMQSALQDNESQAAEASGVSNELKPGVTIDLSRKNIQELPDEVVDIIKSELERLALSHNKLSTFPTRFSECTSLRYLNVRNNHIREFPLPLCDLKSLEILDLGRNKIRTLPPEIAKLTSLKVLAVQKNKIEELPLCLADMVSLQVLKLDGNNIVFPPKEVFQVQAASPPNDGYSKESEVTEVTMTAHIKRFLRQKSQSINGRDRDPDNTGEDTFEAAETPRAPLKRVMSGRFPIRVNGSDVTDPRSPAGMRPPAFPSRAHARGLSQQSTTIRRPNVMPLTIGNPNERVRSNSESLFQATKTDRPSERQRRMGLVSKRANELGTLEETEANNRFSHLRGLSHGSSMLGTLNYGNPNGVAPNVPNSPVDTLLQRPNYVRRLSVLPEQRRESRVFDPVIESAKGILYAIFQIHPMIQLFTGLTRDDSDRDKRTSLEMAFYFTNQQVEQLEQEIQKHELDTEHGMSVPRENESVHAAVISLITAYTQICSIFVANMDKIVNIGDPRYIRTMMTTVYNTIMELRVTANEVSAGGSTQSQGFALDQSIGNTIKPHARQSSAASVAERPGMGLRYRPGPFVHQPSALRVATDASSPYMNGNGQVATSAVPGPTPLSGESFGSVSADGRYARDPTIEERVFEKIFLSLQKSTDLVARTLPNFLSQFNIGKRKAEVDRVPEPILNCWRALVAKCSIAIRETDNLKNRLSLITLQDGAARADAGFWVLCKAFIDAWAEYGNRLKQSMDQIQLPLDIRTRLRPIQISVKETNQLIVQSPWAYLFRQAGHFADGPAHYSPHHYLGPGGMGQVPIPMTPQSAALGPAVQATVPSTPQSLSFSSAFSGDVFERADALISMGGRSMSRTGTMNSTSSTSFYHSSSSSMTSTSEVDRFPPSAMLSPNNGSATSLPPPRAHGMNKASY